LKTGNSGKYFHIKGNKILTLAGLNLEVMQVGLIARQPLGKPLKAIECGVKSSD
jgi:hypothetical protein